MHIFSFDKYRPELSAATMSAAAGCFNVGHMCVRIPRKEGEVQKIACPGSIHEKPFSSLIYYKAEERCLVYKQ